MALLEIKNLSFTYALDSKPSLNNINLEIEKGEFVVICGSTGSGKSTLLKMFKPEIRPKGILEGNIFYKDKAIDEYNLKESITNFGMVMQNPTNQIVSEKVASELAFGLENIGCDPKVIAVRIAEISNYFGINNWYNEITSNLSGGQKQILNLASILAMNPEVLLIDEPTSQVDPITASEFFQTIKKINQDYGLTILLVEHRLDEVFSLCDKVVILDEGRIVASGAPKEVGKQIVDERLYLNLPTLFRVWKKLGVVDLPLTVKEGQKLLEKYNNEIKYIEKQDGPLEDEILKIKNLYFKYYKEQNDILEDLSLSVYKNEIFSIVGSNGSGKTTLLKILARLLVPYYGKIYINGINLKKIKDDDLYYQNIAYLPQNSSDILFAMSVREELDYDNLKNENILKLLKQLELENLLDKHPDDLSGGEIQKVAFGKILCQEPKILLLDEPTKGLDAFLKGNLINILKSLQDNNITIIIVSHDLEFCAKISNRIGLLFAGKIAAISDPNTFFSNNYFYSTIINKIARSKYPNAVIETDLYDLIKINGGI
jgi:energy-coupling factor transport system ATP-binding protein